MTPHLFGMMIFGAGVLLASAVSSQSLDGRRGYGGSSLTPEALELPGLQQHLKPSPSRPGSSVPPRSPDLGSAFSPLTPSIGPGSGSLGPEAGPGASRRFISPSDKQTGIQRLRNR